MKTSWLVLALAAAVLSFAGLGIAASQETYKVSAHLTGSQETPKNTSKATGSFTGTVVEKGESKTLKWKLTFKGLSGAAQAAHVHLGQEGRRRARRRTALRPLQVRSTRHGEDHREDRQCARASQGVRERPHGQVPER